MARHDDLAELNALAASIAEETDSWRHRRRQQAAAVAAPRTAADQLAPTRRRRRHRVAAGICIGLIAVVTGAAIAVHAPTHSAPARHRAAAPARELSEGAVLGRQAALTLTNQGRVPDAFACLGWLDHQSGALSNQSATFRSDYLSACADAAGTAAEER